MNTLKVNVITLKQGASLVRDGIYFDNGSYLQLLIDNRDIVTFPTFEDMFVVFDELYKSSLQSGEYLLFTCACGIADDGGYSKCALLKIAL